MVKRSTKKKIRTSGNGSISKQYIYILWNWPYFWVVKIGITRYLSIRPKQIDRSAKGKDCLIFWEELFFAWHIEQIILFICRGLYLRVKFDGSGRTERFFILALPIALVVIIGAFLVQQWTYILIAACMVGIKHVLYG